MPHQVPIHVQYTKVIEVSTDVKYIEALCQFVSLHPWAPTQLRLAAAPERARVNTDVSLESPLDNALKSPWFPQRIPGEQCRTEGLLVHPTLKGPLIAPASRELR